MGSIIEKLGIKSKYRPSIINGDIILDLENQKNEMLGALIDIAIDKSFFTLNRESQRRVDIARQTLEKVTGKKWGKIKELLNA